MNVNIRHAEGNEKDERNSRRQGFNRKWEQGAEIKPVFTVLAWLADNVSRWKRGQGSVCVLIKRAIADKTWDRSPMFVEIARGWS